MQEQEQKFTTVTSWIDETNNIEVSMKTIERFPKRLKILREIHNYTQEYIAEELGVSQSNYSKIEKGGHISFERIMRVINVYKISFADFLEFDLGKIILKNNLKL